VVTVAAAGTIVTIEASKIMAHLLGAAPEMGWSEATCVDFLPRTTQLRASVKPAVPLIVVIFSRLLYARIRS
jgi:hypothetical protein